MASYYKNKQLMFASIIKLLSQAERTEIAHLNYFALKEYGFGDKLVFKMLQQIEEQGLIEIKESYVLSKVFKK